VLWFYRDPQGNIQGPFTGADMHEWYKAGFFTAQLLVKRESDPDFQPLGLLVQILGNDEEPFLMPAQGAGIPAGLTAAEYEMYLASQAGYAMFDGTPWPEQQHDEKNKQDRQRLVGVLQQRGENSWSKNGQPGSVPKSLKEIQEEEERKKKH
jgi:hypothetical protein